MQVFFLIFSHPANIAKITVQSPATPIAIPLIAPSISPISIALEVPSAWLAVPIATPAATGFFTRNSLIRAGASIAPTIPVTTTAATVTDTMPPCCSEIPIAIGVVTDLGRREAVKIFCIFLFILLSKSLFHLIK